MCYISYHLNISKPGLPSISPLGLLAQWPSQISHRDLYVHVYCIPYLQGQSYLADCYYVRREYHDNICHLWSYVGISQIKYCITSTLKNKNKNYIDITDSNYSIIRLLAVLWNPAWYDYNLMSFMVVIWYMHITLTQLPLVFSLWI